MKARGAPQVYHAMARDRLRAIGHSMGAATLLAIASRAGDWSAAHILRFILMWLLVLTALAVRRTLARVGMAGHLSDLGSHTTALRVSLHYTVFIVFGPRAADRPLRAFQRFASRRRGNRAYRAGGRSGLPTLPGDAAAPREHGSYLKQFFNSSAVAGDQPLIRRQEPVFFGSRF